MVIVNPTKHEIEEVKMIIEKQEIISRQSSFHPSCKSSINGPKVQTLRSTFGAKFMTIKLIDKERP